MKIAFAFLALIPLAGCSSVGKLIGASKGEPPALTVTPTEHGSKVEQTGTSEQPARVVTTDTLTNVPIAPGSTITISPPPVQTPDEVGRQPAGEVTLRTRTQDVTGPRAYAPPAPPTAAQVANADAIRQSYYFAGALIVGAGFLFWRAHLKAAAVAAVCAVLVPIVANFAGSAAAQKLFIAAVCISGALFAAWHFMQDNKNQT